MARRALSARISADITLDRIEIALSRFDAPLVTLHGTLTAVDRRVGQSSKVSIQTAWLGEAGEAFIGEMKAALSSAAPAPHHEKGAPEE